jgi:ABC-type transporter Mla maintaining outer membrane lipid asymmetry permease subunit MlaE
MTETDSLPVMALRRVGAVCLFFFAVLARIGPALAKPGLIVKQIYNAGARSLVIVMLSGMFVGMVLGLLGFDVFQRSGRKTTSACSRRSAISRCWGRY